jgi:hypothetical protein
MTLLAEMWEEIQIATQMQDPNDGSGLKIDNF